MRALHTFFIALICVSVNGLIHDLTIENDSRSFFFIENFGMLDHGYYSMTITNWKVGGEPFQSGTDKSNRAGFLVKVSQADNPNSAEEHDVCQLDAAAPSEKILVENWNFTKHELLITKDNEGFYNTFFVNCLKQPVSFKLHLEQYNVINGHKSYLSAGLTQLPTIYGVFTAVYVALLVVWIFGFMRGPGKTVNRIHHLMTILVILKILSLLFQGIELHFTKTTGYAGGWQVAYFIFGGLKTIFFFVLVALIGTGWTFVKPFLSEKDKKIIMVVVPLQVLDNIALIIIEETAPGSQGWFTWKDIFRLVDIICCGAVLIPIIWSIKHLREASQIDGKVARNLQKLKLFRQFYLIVVSYIYFTRIIIFLLDATLPFKLVWMGDMFTELASLCFFVVVGYKFSPSEDNPYFKMDMDDDTARALAEKEGNEDL